MKLKKDEYFVIKYKATNGHLQLGQVIIGYYTPYVTRDLSDLIVYEDLVQIPDVEVVITKNPDSEVSVLRAKAKEVVLKDGQADLSPLGLIWLGDTKFKTTGFGVFEKGVAKFGLTKAAVKELVATSKKFSVV